MTTPDAFNLMFLTFGHFTPEGKTIIIIRIITFNLATFASFKFPLMMS